MKKAFVFAYLFVILFTYGFLLYKAILLRDTTDFAMFYYSAKHLVEGASIYAATPWYLFHIPHFLNSKEVFFQLPIHSLGVDYSFNLNTPVFTLLTFWFAYLSYPVAASIWVFFTLGSAALSVFILYRNFFDRQTFFGYAIFLGIFLATLSFSSNLMMMEMGSMVLLAVVSVWALARNNHDIFAGLLLGLLLSTKYFFGLIALLFFLQRRWQLITWCIGTFLVLNATALVYAGNVWGQYQEIIHRVVWYANDWNASVFGFFSRFGSSVKLGVFTPAPWVFPATVFCSVLLIVYQIKICWKRFSDLRFYDEAFSYTLIATMFIAPLSWLYYLGVLLLPVLCLLRVFSQKEIQEQGKPVVFFAWAIALLNYPNTFHVISMSGVGGIAFEHSVYFYGLCFFLGLFVYLRQKSVVMPLKISQSSGLSPWVVLLYILTAPAFVAIFYGIFLKNPPIWA